MEVATCRDQCANSDSTFYTTTATTTNTNTIIIIKKSKQRGDRHFTSSQVPNDKIADPSITAYSGIN